jgi:GntR family transcriptional regulator/MocR family aminotransferase
MPGVSLRQAVQRNSHLSRDFDSHYDLGMRTAGSGIAPILSIERDSAAPLYRQLYEGFRDAILARRLRAGQRIPSTRSLAIELRISRLPLLNAYEQLAAEGYLECRTGSGTFVASVPAMGSPASARAAVRRGARRPIARDTDSIAADVEPWLGRRDVPRAGGGGGWGAFRVSEPALDRFGTRAASARIPTRCATGTRWASGRSARPSPVT